MIRRALLVATLLGIAAAPPPAAAQADTTARDTSGARVRDTTPPDTIPHYLAAFAPALPAGPLPHGTRYTFDADSLRFSDATTLADLLLHVPGVYIARGGAYGAPEVALYGGRGPPGIEVYWDGVPYLPLGRDSGFLDLARVSLAPLERVDVIVLPATLRVYLTTSRQRSTVPTSSVRIETGDLSVADYRGTFARRWRSGMGLALAADWNAINDDAATSTTAFNSVDLWLKGEYIPGGRLGISYEVLSSTWDRSARVGVVDRWRFKRQDGLLRVFAGARADGLGPRFEAALLRTSISRDTAIPGRSGALAQVAARQTWRRASLAVTGRFSDFLPRSSVEVEGGWTPVPRLTLAADGRIARYAGRRTGRRAHASGGLSLPLGFSLHGDVASMRDATAPALATGGTQWALDASRFRDGISTRSAAAATSSRRGTRGSRRRSSRGSGACTRAACSPCAGSSRWSRGVAAWAACIATRSATWCRCRSRAPRSSRTTCRCRSRASPRSGWCATATSSAAAMSTA
ncbi:MAG: hypothetical protein DMD74_10855 [Gemmatimonadetes bacterium]|nr:MAG: hypothetical protein DMD74_10855 [Gemmatimonadota bacterium]